MKQPDSNPLRKQLARNQQGESHPDSDVLAAFAEGSLLARERESVMEHLALCTRCREELSIASEASPEVVEVQPLLLLRPTHPPLRSWLPWAAVAAGVLVVSSALLLHQQRPGGDARSTASTSAATKIVQSPAQLSQLPTSSEPKSATGPHKTRGSVARRETARRQEEYSSASSASARTIPQEPQPEQRLQAQAEVAGPINHAAVGSQSPGPRAEEPSGVALKKNQTSPDQMARAKSAPATSQVTEGQRGVAADSQAAFAGAAMHKATTVEAMRPHWRINDLGQLERSFGSSGWQPVATLETSRLHVVSVSGNDVWAGGENLRLEHSTDNGNSWQSIELPPKNGYNHAVTHVRFQTTQAGTVVSDDGTSWVTSDGGSTWK